MIDRNGSRTRQPHQQTAIDIVGVVSNHAHHPMLRQVIAHDPDDPHGLQNQIPQERAAKVDCRAERHADVRIVNEVADHEAIQRDTDDVPLAAQAGEKLIGQFLVARVDGPSVKRQSATGPEGAVNVLIEKISLPVEMKPFDPRTRATSEVIEHVAIGVDGAIPGK